ncbi:hypothetical protein Droror1_Dr00018920 [Drosera rotundifolia]
MGYLSFSKHEETKNIRQFKAAESKSPFNHKDKQASVDSRSTSRSAAKSQTHKGNQSRDKNLSFSKIARTKSAAINQQKPRQRRKATTMFKDKAHIQPSQSSAIFHEDKKKETVTSQARFSH